MTDNIDKPFKSCQEVLGYICEHFGDDEDSPRCRALERHLENCPDCAAYCDSIEKMIGLYRATAPCFPEGARQMLLHSLGIDEQH